MTKVALLGAGGKMGVRLATNLTRTDFEVAHVEVSPAGQARLKAETGLDCVPQEAALAGAEVLTVPAAFTRQTGEAHWHALLRARAIENGAFVVAAAQGGLQSPDIRPALNA